MYSHTHSVRVLFVSINDVDIITLAQLSCLTISLTESITMRWLPVVMVMLMLSVLCVDCSTFGPITLNAAYDSGYATHLRKGVFLTLHNLLRSILLQL